MSRTALMYIMMPGGGSPLYAGKIEFEADLAVDRPNSYLENGARHIVRIIRIVAATSESDFPAVFVEQLMSDRRPVKAGPSRG